MQFQILVTPLQRQFEAAADQTLLLAAEQSGVILPSSCRNGTCRTCICKMRSGSVRYLVEWPGLSQEEKQEGYVLPCVATATSNVVIEQAQATDSRGR